MTREWNELRVRRGLGYSQISLHQYGHETSEDVGCEVQLEPDANQWGL